MANVAFKKGLLAGLSAAPISAGTFHVTTDERAIYLDIDDATRIRLGDFQEFATLEALKANNNPSTSALYYISGLNVLAKWNGTEYVQINLDTGATSFEVVGTGNAVTAVAYDAATRKLTLTKGETFATKAELDELDGYVGEIPEGYTEATVIAYINKKAEEVLSAAQGGSSETAASVKQALDTYKAETEPRLEALEAVDHEHANKELLDTYTQTEADLADAVAKKHEHANAAELAKIVDGDKAKWDKAVTDLADEIERAKGAEGTNAQAAADALAEAQKKVASVTAADNSVTVGGTATAPTVAAKISQDADNALALAEDGLKVVIPAAAEYSIVKAENSGDYAAVYNLTKGGEIVGASINIPKDMVVKSGSVVDGDIVLVLNDEENTEIVIPADSLIEYVTSGSVAGDMVVISVSDDHKVTASITDGTITAAKLTTELQTAIGKAHSHDNKAVLDGITEQKVADWDDAVAKEHEHANKAELDKIADGDKAKWDAAATDTATIKADYLKGADKTELEGDIAAAQAAAEKVANDNNAAMDTRVKALEAIDHDAYKAYADQAETDAVTAANAYADGLASNYDAVGSAAAAQAAAELTASNALNAALAWGEF